MNFEYQDAVRCRVLLQTADEMVTIRYFAVFVLPAGVIPLLHCEMPPFSAPGISVSVRAIRTEYCDAT